MWETTFALYSHAGLGRPFDERNILTSMKHVRKVPTQSGVAIERCHSANVVSHMAYKLILSAVNISFHFATWSSDELSSSPCSWNA